MNIIPLRFRALLVMVGLALGSFTLSAVQSVVPEVPADRIESVSGPFYPLDLSSVANRRLTALGGRPEAKVLTDQGENDLRGLPLGEVKFLGVPFAIPAGDASQLVVLRGQSHEAYPNQIEIPVGKRAGNIYFLHGSAWSAPLVGTYRVVYEDSTEVRVPLRLRMELFDWWQPGRTHVAEVGWRGANPLHHNVGLALFPWANPHPAKTIRAIVAERRR